MADQIDEVGSLSGIQSAASEAQVTAVQGSLQGSSEVDPSAVKIASLDDLKNKFPDVYNAFMLMWANQFRAESQRFNDRVIEAQRKGRNA